MQKLEVKFKTIKFTVDMKNGKLGAVTDYNLDAMSIGELQEFVNEIGQGTRPVRAARQLFPELVKGRVQVTKELRNYAWNKMTAMQLRIGGRIERARAYEQICDRIYARLPEWGKGW